MMIKSKIKEFRLSLMGHSDGVGIMMVHGYGMDAQDMMAEFSRPDFITALKEAGITAADFEDRPAEEPKRSGRHAATERLTFQQQFAQLPMYTRFKIGTTETVFVRIGTDLFAPETSIVGERYANAASQIWASSIHPEAGVVFPS